MTSVAKRLLLNGKDLLPTVRDAQSPKNLYKLLNVYPNYGVGLKVAPDHWVNKGITNSYYEITKVKLKMKDITHGRVFGIKVWDGTVRRIRKFKIIIRLSYTNHRVYIRKSIKRR
ncbi:hypothetical protein F8M41_020592 [Gigaspora margarita]|uniref:Uncharacterized protein n=1 Tax=Gigaspora margarita TaxID=4874 RepID=A0A8H4EJL3_GIGMA|nr:hypothetical protein F8M41_020592 [Gigaspora margarita]